MHNYIIKVLYTARETRHRERAREISLWYGLLVNLSLSLSFEYGQVCFEGLVEEPCNLANCVPTVSGSGCVFCNGTHELHFVSHS